MKRTQDEFIQRVLISLDQTITAGNQSYYLGCSIYDAIVLRDFIRDASRWEARNEALIVENKNLRQEISELHAMILARDDQTGRFASHNGRVH